MADEGAFLELLVANERVGRLLDVLVDPTQRSRHKSTIMQLQTEVQRGSSYVEEAHRAGAIQILTNLLARTTSGSEELRADEAVMDVVSRIISACSGPMAAGGKVSCFSYGHVSIHIREGALGDGLGSQVWAVSHIMCRELLRHPEVVAFQQVLEIGSGTGLVGILAAKLGAGQVLLTDHEPEVLRNLRACMHLNASCNTAAQPSRTVAVPCCTQGGPQQTAAAPSTDTALPAAAAGSHGDNSAAHPLGAPSHALEDLSEDEFDRSNQHSASGAVGGFTDAELFDDAESVEDFDLTSLLSPRSSALQQHMEGRAEQGPSAISSSSATGGGMSTAAGGSSSSWEVDNMVVRLLDWQESHDAMEGPGSNSSPPGADAAAASTAADRDSPPGVSLDVTFPVILGNEVMYEPAHARLVAACLHHRLAPGGRALLCCAVRDQGVFDTFRDSCTARGLRYRAVQVQPEEERDVGGIRGRERDYEGGFLLMAVDHSSSPAQDWHRDDFQVVE